MTVRIRDIQAHVGRVFGLPVATITGRSRRQNVVRARHAVCYLARELTGKSYPFIGRLTGGRDHSTIMHGRDQCIELMSRDAAYRAMVERAGEMAQTGETDPIYAAPEPDAAPEVIAQPEPEAIAPDAGHDGLEQEPVAQDESSVRRPWWLLSDDELLSEAVARHYTAAVTGGEARR